MVFDFFRRAQFTVRMGHLQGMMADLGDAACVHMKTAVGATLLVILVSETGCNIFHVSIFYEYICCICMIYILCSFYCGTEAFSSIAHRGVSPSLVLSLIAVSVANTTDSKPRTTVSPGTVWDGWRCPWDPLCSDSKESCWIPVCCLPL